MKRRRGWSTTTDIPGVRNHRVFGLLCWKLGIVLISCVLAMSCGKESPSESEAGTERFITAESVSKKDNLDAEPSTGQEEISGPRSMEPTATGPATTEPAKEKKLAMAEIAGVAFTQKLIELLNYELHGRFWGWRPNDLIIGRLTDNVNEFQLGALEAIRYTALKLKESLTRFGDADAYDPNLVEAVNLLMNRADQFWFPSSESQYESALDRLKKFLNNLKQGRSRFYYRTENLQGLVTSYKDLLGNCHENLVKAEEPDGSRVSYFRADNYFYYCQGVTHVIHDMLGTVRVGFVEQLQTLDAVALMDKIVEDLERASECYPWLITNSGDDGILANHRYNLAAPISSALHNMSTMLRY